MMFFFFKSGISSSRDPCSGEKLLVFRGANQAKLVGQLIQRWQSNDLTPSKINMEHNSEGLEDDFPL